MSMNKFIRLLQERIEGAQNESDASAFDDCLVYGECIFKLAIAFVVAGLADDKEGTRYTIERQLVSANSIGEWADALDQMTIGPASVHVYPGFRAILREITQNCASGSWQHEASRYLRDALVALGEGERLGHQRVPLRAWFRDFVAFRNKTRGHGALTIHKKALCYQDLRASIDLIAANLQCFSVETAYLYRSLSGKYRVSPIFSNADAFRPLKSSREFSLDNGVYIYVDDFIRLNLVESDPELRDFYLPNGNRKPTGYEVLSYATGERVHLESARYKNSGLVLVKSETEGRRSLEIIGNVFSNMPLALADYVERQEIENALAKNLQDDRRLIVTLQGRGGIGKTALTLHVLSALAHRDCPFYRILWFSARDIDLLPRGAKRVRPQILDLDDVAKLYSELSDAPGDKGAASELFLTSLSDGGFPSLYVFDNFETLQEPVEFFELIDTHIRHPNKILITTRHREFRGDYPIDVRGMKHSECIELIEKTSRKLGIWSQLSDKYIENLVEESDGHPYVIKLLLGETERSGNFGNVRRIIASADDVLSALFERTFARLSPVAQRVFLTVSSWRSLVPFFALEVVLLEAEGEERVDVQAAIDELSGLSFVEVIESLEDSEYLVSVPSVAATFGKKKLLTSPQKIVIERDVFELQKFGSLKRQDLGRGVKRLIDGYLSQLARKLENGELAVLDLMPRLEYLAIRYPTVYLRAVEMFKESDEPRRFEFIIRFLQAYLEVSHGRADAVGAWVELSQIYRDMGNTQGEIHALVEMSSLADAPFHLIARAADRVNSTLRDGYSFSDAEERVLQLKNLVANFRRRIDEGDANDYSKLAWLCLNMKDPGQAKDIVGKGLEIDPNNGHLIKLIDRLES